MYVIPRSGFLAFLAILTSTLAGAQVTLSAQTAPCADTTAIRPYEECALFIDGSVVRQNPDLHAVGRDARFHRMPLSRLVTGDSARQYATQYERDVRVADRLYVLGGAFIAGTAVIALSYRCGTRESWGACSNNAEPYLVSGAVLSAGALAVALVQFSLKRHAWRAVERAIAWHNAGLKLR